ncbi:Hypothetical predicted protein [Mytilus galloprovincialis]|uniref:Gustatory receptor n=1 Tax=Mytilus galloprovincialis TaxID=29158 RepID=A0A8B6CPQ0_MYTGA|nr:Hypothetical predicted protein [Mytilus galloprovincialis]
MNDITRIKPLHDPSVQSTGMDGTKTDIEEERASDAFKPLIRFLEIFGSYSQRQKRGRKYAFKIHFTYCILVQQLDDLESLRLQHECIVELVKVGNLMFRHIGGMTYVYGIPMICLTLYGATMRSLDTVDICALVGVMMVVVIVMFIITFMGAYMCQAAHEPLDDLYKIYMSKQSPQIISQYLRISISLLNDLQELLRKKDKKYLIFHDYYYSTVLMVFGTIITYAVIAIQFTSTGSPSDNCLYNHTNVTFIT